jgi:hypothetical protein
MFSPPRSRESGEAQSLHKYPYVAPRDKLIMLNMASHGPTNAGKHLERNIQIKTSLSA